MRLSALVDTIIDISNLITINEEDSTHWGLYVDVDRFVLYKTRGYEKLLVSKAFHFKFNKRNDCFEYKNDEGRYEEFILSENQEEILKRLYQDHLFNKAIYKVLDT